MYSNAEVVHLSTEFLRLMSRLCEPQGVCFRTFTREGVVDDLCELAATVATGGTDSSVSLTILPGDGSFEIQGSRAVATLRTEGGSHTRVMVISLLLVVVILVLLVLRR